MTSLDARQTPRLRVAAVITRGNAVLLVEHVKDGRHNFLLPGGGVRFGETLHDALVRELWEETRLEVSAGRMLFVCESIAPDGERHMVQVAFAADTRSEPAPGDDPRVAGAHFVDADRLAALEMYPPIQQVLIEGLRNGFPATPAYLGNIWLALPPEP